MTDSPITAILDRETRDLFQWRERHIEDMTLEVLSRPECYDIDRLVQVTYQEDNIWSSQGERIEIHRKAAGRHRQVMLAGIRLIINAKDDA